VTVADLRVGLPVEYLGDADANVVLSESLRAAGMVLYSGHPGRVRDITVQHVQVTWVGLEDEPASYAVGFSVNSPNDLTYGALGLLTVEEFECRERVLEDAAASQRNLSGWVPPWPTCSEPAG
jgi:hypothetical protein